MVLKSTLSITITVTAELKETLDRYAEEYKKYFERNLSLRGEKKIMLDALPRVILLPGVGVATFGNSSKDARIAMDIYEHTMSVIDTCESISHFQALPEEDIFDVEYWVLEQAKLALGAKTLPLSGKIAAISGGTTGIGLAIATEMLENGADVFVLDIDQTKFEPVEKGLKQKAKAGNSVKLVACDVTSRSQVEKAIKEIVREKGGIDLVVANAGIFPASKSVESISEGDWNRTMMVNLNGTFHLLACTLPWMKSQAAGGDIILVASKNVPAPGKEAGAYSVSKAAQVQLARHRGMSRVDAALCDRLLARLDEWIADDEPPALLHGDLWSGNLLCDAAGVPVLVDPAAYFGHREAEFGMTALFCGFSRRMYDAYHEFHPLRPGWQERVDLYTLYHLLNHFNLFGGAYLREAMVIVRRFVG